MNISQPEHVINSDATIRWMRDVIAKILGNGAPELTRISISIANTSLDVFFDDKDMAEDFRVTVYHQYLSEEDPARIYVITNPAVFGINLPMIYEQSYPETTFRAQARAAGFYLAYPHNPDIWKFLDERTNIGVQISRSRKALPPWEATAPLRHHLHWLLDREGQRFAHAATLGDQGHGVVLFGPGGAGKSGTTLAGLSVGLQTVGDDYVALSLEDNVIARPLFRVVKQDRAGLARSPSLADGTSQFASDWRGKIAFDPSEFFADAFVERLELGAVILPHIKHLDAPRLYPARAQEVMLALMTSNLHQFPSEMKSGMAFFAALLRRLPCFHLDLSDDARRNGALIKAFITNGFRL